MKRTFKILFILFQILFVFACSDKEDNDNVRNELTLSVNHQSIELDEADANEPVLTFSWNKAADIGAEYTFDYIFQLDIANNGFKTASEPVKLKENGTISFTASELYDLIVDQWENVSGETVVLDARIVARVNGGDKFQYPEIAYTKVEITTYIPISRPLYILGTATTANLDPDNAIQMHELSNGRTYSARVSMQPGNFKFITTKGSMLPSYNKGTGDNKLVERTLGSEPDNYFEITEAGMYYINVSLKTMTLSYKKSAYDNVYLVGDAVPTGWDLNTMPGMTQDLNDPDIFTITIALKEGELKMPTGRSWEHPAFRPVAANGSITSQQVRVNAGDPDNKWKITSGQAGTYKITLNTNPDNMSIKFEKQ